MTLTIELTADQEARLSAFAKRQRLEPAELAKKLVTEFLPLVDSLDSMALSPAERFKAMDALAEKNRGLPHLPDAAFDRETLYDERF